MSVVDACIIPFVEKILSSFSWEDGFYPTVSEVRPRLRHYEEEIRRELCAAGLPLYIRRGSNSDGETDEEEEHDGITDRELDIFIKCCIKMRRTVFPRMAEEMACWDECTVVDSSCF